MLSHNGKRNRAIAEKSVPQMVLAFMGAPL
jgi:hypothetical protein